MKIGVFATFMSPIATPAMIRDFGKRAENIGLDSIWMGEHVVLFDKNTFGYPASKDGRIPMPWRKTKGDFRSRCLRLRGFASRIAVIDVPLEVASVGEPDRHLRPPP